jgi:ADP-dependent NAD(P)H-hydrate dehydratase / NAD(P)H-hydrate epimerase
MHPPLTKKLALQQAKASNGNMSFQLNTNADHIIQRPQLLPPAATTHKYDRGHAVLISGPVLRTGASRLSAKAALAVGAGLVTIVGNPAALAEHAAHVTAIMLQERDAAFSVIDDRVRSLLIGPGAGVSAELEQDVATLLERKIPIVLDADALTAFSTKPATLFGMLHAQAVLTPHEGEFARLFPDISLNDRTKATLEASGRAGAVILLKGAETIVAAPAGRFAINCHASPWLATAGSGDVLAGLICGQLSQGNSAFNAAAIACWLHGDIGIRAGPGLTADDMVGHLALVLRGILQEA